MEQGKRENNVVAVSGKIVSDLTYSHESFAERFYTFYLQIRRLSGTLDIIPIMISEQLINIKADHKRKYVIIRGQYRSSNKKQHVNGQARLELVVFARDIEEINGKPTYDTNRITLDGFICKLPVYHESPLGREICDAILAVNRQYGKSDYIPYICWGREAKWMRTLPIGTHLKLDGRIQSRLYLKRISDTEQEERVAYEISVSKAIMADSTRESEEEDVENGQGKEVEA